MKICFWGDIAAALAGKTIGGGELQIALLARSLAKAGHEVVIIDPFSESSFTTPDGIKIIHVPGWNKGIPALRILNRRMPEMYRLFLDQKADYYYVRMRSYYHMASYRAARKLNASFIVALAHDLDTAGFFKRFRHEYLPKFSLKSYLTLHLPNDIVFRYLLKRADLVTLQHEGQRMKPGMIRGRQAVFHNIFDYSMMPEPAKGNRDYYIIAGSITPLKGASHILELARLLDKKNRIIIVGEPRGREAEKVYRELRKMPNIELKGRLPHRETVELISNARALINTSNYEGFPNIFLEAWAAGVPVISLNVNPGNVIDEHQLGLFCHGNVQEMQACIEQDKSEQVDRSRMLSYIRRFHEVGLAAYNFISILECAVVL